MSVALQTGMLAATMMGILVAFVRMPKWCARSVHRHRLWRERDAIADDRHDRWAPYQRHPAVRNPLRHAEWHIEDVGSATMLRLYLSSRVRRNTAMTRLPAKRSVSLDGLSGEERACMELHLDRVHLLTTGSVITGSWSGLASILRFVLPALWEQRKKHRTAPTQGSPASPGLERELQVSFSAAADRATARSWNGQRSGDFIAAQERDWPVSGIA